MGDSLTESIPKTAIEAVLFDADGVLQTVSAGVRDNLAQLLPPGDDDVDGFIEELFKVERPALADGSDVIPSFSALLRRRGSNADPGVILSILNSIVVHSEMLGVVDRLRESGIKCYLASNQQRHRAKYMSETLGYRERFDRQFYSCWVGDAKPSRAYFEQVLAAIDLPPDRVLFLDDQEDNVAGARELGIHASVFQLHRGVDNRRVLVRLLRSYGLRVDQVIRRR